MKALRAWVAVRVLVPLGLLVLFPAAAGELAAGWITRLPYAHGAVKFALILWQSMLRREEQVLAVLTLALLAGLVLPRLTGRAFVAASSVLLVALALALRPASLPLGLLPLLINLLPWRLPLALTALPGSELLFPVPLARALDLWPRAVSALAAPLLALVWVVADGVGAFAHYEAALLQPWPQDRVDPRVTTVATAPAGVKCDFHDVDLVGERVVVVAESSLRLLSYPDGAAWPLTPWWGRVEGLAMDSETDAASGTTVFHDGPNSLASVRWTEAGWTRAGRSPHLPVYLHHVYMHAPADSGRLHVFTIGTHNVTEPPLLLSLTMPGLGDLRVLRIQGEGGERVPVPRDIAWIPPLARYALVPDMGERVWLLDPTDGRAVPWLTVPTVNGRPTWIPELGRLLLPMPNLPEIWLVDPVSGAIERIGTQPGVRTADVDVGRGLLLTASVLTGAVWVQELDGTLVDSYRTLMPMSRTLVADTRAGQAWLSTWTALYRIPYGAD